MRLTCQKELKKSLRLVVLFMGTVMVPAVSYAQFGSLKGLAKKAKEKAQETVGNSTESISGVTEDVLSAISKMCRAVILCITGRAQSSFC